MVELYKSEEFAAAKKARKTLIIIYVIIAVVYAGLTAVVFIFNTRERGILSIALCSVLSTLFFGFTLFFFAIKFRRTRSYCRMFRDFSRGLTEEAQGIFLRFERETELKDGVDCYPMIILQKSIKREQVELERKVLIEATRPRPDVVHGETIKVKTHANILMQYEVLVDERIREEEREELERIKKPEPPAPPKKKPWKGLDIGNVKDDKKK